MYLCIEEKHKNNYKFEPKQLLRFNSIEPKQAATIGRLVIRTLLLCSFVYLVKY